jgi:hypothetical protein
MSRYILNDVETSLSLSYFKSQNYMKIMRKNLIGIVNLHISTIVLLKTGTVLTVSYIFFYFIIGYEKHLAIQSIQFDILFKSHLSITGHNTHIKQSYNNKLESHSLQNYKRL